jgi:hypothetical protein
VGGRTKLLRVVPVERKRYLPDLDCHIVVIALEVWSDHCRLYYALIGENPKKLSFSGFSLR